MYTSDTGLFVTLAFKDNDLTENVIYEKLLGDKLITFADNKKYYEVDFPVTEKL